MDKIKKFIQDTIEVQKTYASPLKRLGSFIRDTISIITISNLFFGTMKYFGYDFNIYKEEAVIENQGTEQEHTTIKKVVDKEKFKKMYIIEFCISSLYFVLFLSSKKQATIGNQIFKIMVVHTKKGRLNPLNALIRYILVVLNNTIYGIGYLTYFVRKDRAFMQDILSDTAVINLIKEEVKNEN